MEKLANKKPPIEDRGKFLRDIALGFEKGQIFLIALKLDVFTQLKEPKTAETLSKELGTHPEITRRFLDVLVALKLLSKREDLYSTATDVTPFLVEGEPYFAKYLKFSIFLSWFLNQKKQKRKCSLWQLLNPAL